MADTKGDFDNMNNIAERLCSVFAFILLALLAAGCGDGSRTTVLNEIIIVQPPEDPTQPPTNPPAPIDSESAVMRLDYKVSQAEASSSTYLAQLRFVALDDEVGLRRLRVSTSKVVPTMTIYVYNAQTYQQQSATFTGTPNGFGGSNFEFGSPSQLFLGFADEVGDLLYVTLAADTSSLDGETASFMVEEMDVTTNNGVTSTSTNGLPIVFDVSFDEYPMLSSTAIISSREALRSNKTTLGEATFENIGIYGADISEVSLFIPTDGLKDVVSLEVQVGSDIYVMPTNQNGNALSGTILTIDVSPLNEAIAAGASKTIKVVGDTLTSATQLSCVIRGLTVRRTGNPAISTFAFGPLDFNEFDGYQRLRATLVVADTTTSFVQGVLPVNGNSNNITLMRLLVTNTGGVAKTLRGVYGRVLSNSLDPVANVWVQDSTSNILDSQNLVFSRSFRLDLQNTLILAPGATTEVQVHISVPSSTVSGKSFQFILEAISSSAGLTIVPAPTGNGSSVSF